MRLPADQAKHRERLFDAMAGLLVELHRHGVYWGDCSLANTLFSRDGQVLQAWLVDAETSEIHPQLSRRAAPAGSRHPHRERRSRHDRPGRPARPPDGVARHPDRGGARDRGPLRGSCGTLLHAEPTFDFADRYRVEGTIRRLNELGFAVDEVALAPGRRPSALRLNVAVGDRRFHASSCTT